MLESYAEENGDVTHVAEFFENDAGEYARKQYLGRAGGFSSAQDYRRSGLSLVPVNFYGYDYVMQPNYTTNVGDGQLFDGLTVPEHQDGLISCFDSATDISLLSPSEAMIANMLEQQIVRDFDNIHAQLQQLNEHALDQVDMLAISWLNVISVQHYRCIEHKIFTWHGRGIRSFDSVCDEAEQLLTVSDLGKSQDCYRVCSHI